MLTVTAILGFGAFSIACGWAAREYFVTYRPFQAALWGGISVFAFSLALLCAVGP